MAPSVVLVPGMACLGTVVYSPLIRALQRLGLEDCHPLNLPSIGCIEESTSQETDSAQLKTSLDLAPNPLEADISCIRALLTRLVDEAKDVLIIAHSYGGTPALAAAEGLWKHRREAGAGGVLKAILLCSSLSLPGCSVASDRSEWCKEQGVELDAGARIEIVDGMPILYPDGMNTRAELFNDLEKEEAEKWAEGLKPCAIGNAMSSAPVSTVGDWRIAYFVTDEIDLAMPAAFQRHLVKTAKSAGADIDTKVMKSGHFVQISHAEEVAGWVMELSL